MPRLPVFFPLGLPFGLFVATFAGARAATLPAPAAPPPAAAGEVVQLSPFEVVETNQGYRAAHTMSGTRLSGKLEDLASSISVVTKEQMADLALLDINDVFAYTGGAEGAGTFTDFSVDRNGSPVDNTERDPNTANRIRGVGAANIALGNFEMSGRVPVDPLAVDAIEISRGPNSSVFGLGNAAGTVNLVPAAANLSRPRSQVQFRADSDDGYRSSLDVNRVLIPGQLAVRGSAAYQYDGYDRKPSGTHTVRLNGLVKFRPFKPTTLSAGYSLYRSHGNRPNVTMPLDGISSWIAAGRPTWDPPTTSARLNGVTIPFTGALVPAYFQSGNLTGSANNSMLGIDDGRVVFWTPSRATSTLNPNVPDQPQFHYVTPLPTSIRAQQPMFASDAPVRSKEIYDWSRDNLAAMNQRWSQDEISTVQVEHLFLQTPRQLLAGQFGWLREDAEDTQRAFYGTPGSSGVTGYLFVDVNERRLDRTPNPNFLRPFIGIADPYAFRSPLKRDTFRLQAAYRLDLTREPSRLAWLGRHELSGYGEYKNFITRRFAYRDVMVSDHSWLPAGVVRANQSAPLSPLITRSYSQYYVGDNVGQNVDRGPASFPFGTYNYRWGNGATGAFVDEPVTLGPANAIDSTGGASNVHTLLKTQGAVWQSHLLRERVVTTLGLRRDRNYSRLGAPPRQLADGITADYPADNSWVSGDWLLRAGTTKTAGVVLKVVRGFSVFVNQSDSFQPSTPAQDLYGRLLPDPTGQGADAGLALSLFDGRCTLRAGRYDTKQVNSRNGSYTIIANRARTPDFHPTNTGALYTQASIWVARAAAAQGVTLSREETNRRLADIMKLPLERVTGDLEFPIGETGDVTAKGEEVELHLNATRYWTVTASATRQESIDSNLSPALSRYINDRVAVWKTIIDPLTGQPWYTSRYSGSSMSDFVNGVNGVLPPLAIATAAEGKSRPQIRQYNFKLSTRYQLAGITDQRLLRQFTVGTGLRWEDRGAIGYYGVEQLPAVITRLDPGRPIFDRAHLYVDPWVRYSRRLFANKVTASLQLNVVNLAEGGRLQPISAWPDGTPNAYRIVDPRKFILTATFDL